MNFSLYIARRYLRSSSKNNAINIINGIASLSIIVGAAALFLFLSVFSGLREFSLSFSNDFDPDLKAFPTKGKIMSVSPETVARLNKIDGISKTSRVIEERVLFVFDQKEQIAWLKGVDSIFPQVNAVHKALLQGQWLEPKSIQVVMGHGIANNLSASLFNYSNPFQAYIPRPGKGDIENVDDAFRRVVLAPVGEYAISEELDNKYVFADLSLTQIMLDLDTDKVSALEFKTTPTANTEHIVSEIHKILPGTTIRTREQLNESLYRMLNTENLAVYLIFTLVLIIALFNLVGALYMMILDKRHNLKTMLHLGAGSGELRQIFILQGSLLSFVGGLIGLGIGGALVAAQQKFQFVMITPSLAYPVAFRIENILVVLATIMALGFIASLVASSRVNKKLFE
ncbi:FtsX-like permease family protein [Flavobacterium silvaticum]|uniref:ABC transporter permease n=1 Tax=Flavobacterium silvaticum TaxID=1852020 RepID=A0A972FKI1_9FLAO|nr:FtsX-like permease family protein [Flavobacterium silvaticum]NMH27714.1 ABC transporter permease [Flavobacterium silvaticum]